MTTKTNKRAQRLKPQRASVTVPDKQPFIEHVRELRRRFVYVVAVVGIGSAVAYGFERQIVNILLQPSHGQNFVYTSPLGGMNFLFSACLDIGLVTATPVIIYQLLAFVRPLMRHTTRRFLLGASAASGFVALCGVLFGYFVGLPSALQLLLHQFTTVQVRPLLTIQSYTQFVALYLLGSALMFQLPLIILLINRIKPLGPRDLLKYERHVIAGSVIAAFIMNPSPNLISQLIVVIPIVASYQVSILLLWLVQRKNTPSPLIQSLRQQDAERQAERIGRPLAPLALAVPVAESLSTSALPEPGPDLQLSDIPYTPMQRPIPAPPAPAATEMAVAPEAEVATEVAAEAVAEPAPAPVDATPLEAAPVQPKRPRRFMDFAPKVQPQLMAPLRRQILVQ